MFQVKNLGPKYFIQKFWYVEVRRDIAYLSGTEKHYF